MRESTLLAERYTVDAAVKSEGGATRWLAAEAGSGRRVLMALVSKQRADELALARAAQHRHLAGLLDILRSFDAALLPPGVEAEESSAIAVAEYVPGRNLQQLFPERLSPVKAVGWVLRLIEAVQALHTAGAVHGAISPYSIVAEPEGRGIAPVLTQLGAPPIGAYCPPERLKGGPPSQSDDVWALHATLYAALTGKAPYDANERDALVKQTLISKPQSLMQLGINEPALWEIISRGLVGERRLRVVELAELSKALDAWERDPRAMPARRAPATRQAPRLETNAAPAAEPVLFDVSALPADFGVAESLRSSPRVKMASASGTGPHRAMPPPLPPEARSIQPSAPTLNQLASQLPRTATPPPLPPPLPSVAARISKRLSFNPFERKRKLWPVIAGAAAAGGLVVYIAIATTQEAPAAPPPREAVPAVAAPKARAPEKPKRSAAEEREVCARSYFPERDFAADVDFAFLCEDGDFRETSRKVFSLAKQQQLTAAASTEKSKDAASVGLGWYELPAAGIMRKSCCQSSAPVALPETPGWCEQLQTAVRQIADDSARAGDLAPVARAYDKAVACLYANRISRPYTYESQPTPAQRAAFQHFLSLAAISEARR
ncbi:MAG: serine/threonine protein kinase [Myxococcota bacterium]